MNDQQIQVLLIDDDEDDYLLTRDLLSDIGADRYTLDWAATYEVALAAILRQQHDLYLVDYHLGARTGLELLREALAQGCQAPLILLTGQGDHEIDLEAMRAGAADYLVKGQINASLVERSIRYALERARTLQALRASEERYARAYQKEQSHNLKLQALNRLFLAAAVLEPDTLIEHTCRLLGEGFGYDRISLGKVDGLQITILPQHQLVHGQSPDLVQPATVVDRSQARIITEAVNQQRIIYAPDVRLNRYHQAEPSSRVQSELAIPILADDRVVGVLDVQSEQINGIPEDDILLLRLAASQLARSIEDAQLVEAAQRTFNSQLPSPVANQLLADLFCAPRFGQKKT